METDLQPGQRVFVIGEVEDDFPVTVLRRLGRCGHCGLPVYRCLTPMDEKVIICRSAFIFPN